MIMGIVSFPAAASIASRVSERLGLSTLTIQGVENETELEVMLTSLQAAESSGCFVQGAGNYACSICH